MPISGTKPKNPTADNSDRVRRSSPGQPVVVVQQLEDYKAKWEEAVRNYWRDTPVT
jgi:hypothetical protein